MLQCIQASYSFQIILRLPMTTMKNRPIYLFTYLFILVPNSLKLCNLEILIIDFIFIFLKLNHGIYSIVINMVQIKNLMC
jgi:hypothetical protein